MTPLEKQMVGSYDFTYGAKLANLTEEQAAEYAMQYPLVIFFLVTLNTNI